MTNEYGVNVQLSYNRNAAYFLPKYREELEKMMKQKGKTTTPIEIRIAESLCRIADSLEELIDMAKAANEMLSDAINSFVKRDDELAKKVIDTDDAIDNYFNNIKLKLAEDFRDSSHNLDSVLDLFMISKYFERIGDHSVNIARWVLYMITGTLEGNTN